MNETKTLRHFGLFMAFAFFILGVGIPLFKHKDIHPVTTSIGIFFLMLALVYPMALKKIREWWLFLGEKLGMINSRILLTVIYLTLFTFIHFIFKMLGRDKFKRKWKAYDSTYVEKQKISAFADPF